MPAFATRSSQALAERVRSLFPAEVGLGVALLGEGQSSDLLAAESAGLTRMVPARAAEFIAGRLALRRAQQALSAACFPVPNATDRSPQWPAGFCGSISHACGLAVAVMAHQSDGLQSLGIDIEDDAPLSADLQDIVLVQEERRALAARVDASRKAKIIFSVKEAVYKAQYPLTGKLFGFDQITVSLLSPTDCFDARFNADILPFQVGSRVAGRYSTGDGLVVAGVSLGATRD